MAVKPTVERMATDCGDVADDYQFHAGASHGYVHSSQVAQESDVSLLIASHERKDDDVAFLPLEAVDRIDRYTLAEWPEEVETPNHFSKIAGLRPIRGDDADVEMFIEKALFPYPVDEVLKGQECEGRFVAVYPAVVFSCNLFTKGRFRGLREVVVAHRRGVWGCVDPFDRRIIIEYSP